MSKSYRKPFMSWIIYKSNKKDKIIANRKFRRVNKVRLKVNPDKLFYDLDEVSNTYNFASDGLVHYAGDLKNNPNWNNLYVKIQRK